MSTQRLPELPQPPSFRNEWGGRVVAWGDALEYGRAIQLATWKAAIENGAAHLEWLAGIISGPHESDGHYAMLHDAAKALRSLPDPSATPQDQGGER